MLTIYKGDLKHPLKYSLNEIQVSEQYLKTSKLSKEELREKLIKQYYE